MNFGVCCDVMGQIVVEMASCWDALGLVERTELFSTFHQTTLVVTTMSALRIIPISGHIRRQELPQVVRNFKNV
jgi:hypothetical protein